MKRPCSRLRAVTFAALLSLALFASLTRPARAHPLTPAALVVSEREGHAYDVTFRRSERLATMLSVVLPSDCARTEPRIEREGDQLADVFVARCNATLEGRSLRILGLTEASLSALVHVTLASGESVSELLSPYRTSFAVPSRSPWWSVLREYLALGVEHLFTGFDHLLFVLGLLLLIGDLRGRLIALTSFTLGHSFTLCLAVLGVLHVPQAPIELGIAASLVVLAYEILEQGRRSGAAWMAASFGLLHGLGFAGALTEAGLPAHAVPLALFGFNVGIELGQVVVVLTAAPLLWLARRYLARLAPHARSAAAYALGGIAAMYCLERTLSLFG